MEKNRKAVRVELGEAKPTQLPQQTAEKDKTEELEIAELEQRITPTSIDSSIGTFF
ncbi:MAG TPA: hypothetical protein VL383_18790 [Gemmatimonadaceae bacterium]|jgi:hypothetical protein|nr:hypothetical protein [Gemmatimonadaceae bacterium]